MSGKKGKGCLVRCLRTAAWALGIFTGGIAILYVVLTVLAGNKEKDVNAAWAAAGLPLEGLLAGMQDHGDSAGTKSLVASAAKLGIVLDTFDPAKSMADVKDRETWKGLRNTVRDLNNLIESPQLARGPIPDALQAYLQEKATVLEEIRTRLRAEVPSWRSEISKGYRAEIPPMLGQVDLCRLLLADAQVALAQGDEALAALDLEAIWRLSEGLVDRPELMGQMVALTMRRMAVIELRHLDAPAPEWEARLENYDPSQGILKAYQCDAAMMGTVVNEPDIGEIISPTPRILGGRFLTALVRPYLRLCCAGVQEIQLNQIRYLQDVWPCVQDEAALKALPPQDDIPAWNLVARIAVPNMTSSWGRAKAVRVASDITRNVMALKAAKGTSEAWPASLPELGKPFCANDQYAYSVTPDGAMTLTFNGTMPSDEILRDFKAPLEYRSAPKSH